MSADGMPPFGAVSARGRQSPRKKTPSQLLAYRDYMDPSRPRGKVTLEDVKQMAVGLLLENHRLPIPPCLLDVLKSQELDEFLWVLLLYVSCFLEHKALQDQPRTPMAGQGVSGGEDEATVKVELARNKMAACYATLLLGLGMPQHHHMACGRSLVSATHRDRHLYECLYSLFSYVPWVAFGRQDLGVIRAETSRLLRSGAFSPDEDPGEDAPPRRHRRRPPLKTSMSQSSPLMSSFLPLPREKSPHLFLRTSGGAGGPPGARGLPGPRRTCDTRALLEELEQRLASGSFGILGKPLREFSRSTLMPLGPRGGDKEEQEEQEEEQEEEEEDSDVLGAQGSKASMPAAAAAAGPSRGHSRGHTGVSRATTEAPLSDTE